MVWVPCRVFGGAKMGPYLTYSVWHQICENGNLKLGLNASREHRSFFLHEQQEPVNMTVRSPRNMPGPLREKSSRRVSISNTSAHMLFFFGVADDAADADDDDDARRVDVWPFDFYTLWHMNDSAFLCSICGYMWGGCRRSLKLTLRKYD